MSGGGVRVPRVVGVRGGGPCAAAAWGAGPSWQVGLGGSARISGGVRLCASPVVLGRGPCLRLAAALGGPSAPGLRAGVVCVCLWPWEGRVLSGLVAVWGGAVPLPIRGAVVCVWLGVWGGGHACCSCFYCWGGTGGRGVPRRGSEWGHVYGF